jgi:hypothetical protein
MKGKKLNSLFESFTKEMNQRLTEKQSERWTGWDDSINYPSEEFRERIHQKLYSKYSTKQDLVDIANYAMFLYARLPD